MGELISSDAELNEADIEQSSWDSDSEGDDEGSLMGSDDEREAVNKRKGKEAKINNSFTGPYPVDPAEFNHTDKGPNFQF